MLGTINYRKGFQRTVVGELAGITEWAMVIELQNHGGGGIQK